MSPQLPVARLAVIALAALALSGCGQTARVTTTVACPALVIVENAKPEHRPETPVGGSKATLEDELVFQTKANEYIDALQLQARKREQQVARHNERVVPK